MERLPGVEGRPILEGAVVVVAHKVSCRHPAAAALGCLPHHHHHVIFGVEHVDQQHLKHQRGLRRDQSSCLGREGRIQTHDVMTDAPTLTPCFTV